MRTVATVEARMTSTRLPGKVLLPAAGKPMLGHLFARLRATQSVDKIVLATTTNATDDALAAFGREEGVDVFRGSEEDVMARVIGAAAMADAELVVEITGDCPVIDHRIIEQCIRMFKHNPCDYLSNASVRSYPDGMDVQVFPLAVLRKSAAMTDSRLDHEHVTLHIRNNPHLFKQVHLVAPPDLHWPDLGLTLDEPADYELLRRLIDHFTARSNPLFSCGDAVRQLRAAPEWADMNKGVARKGDT